MADTLNSLRDLIFSTPEVSIGIVSNDKGSVLTVATPKGMKDMPKSNDIKYNAGDSVRIFNGVAVGKVQSVSSLPTYYV